MGALRSNLNGWVNTLEGYLEENTVNLTTVLKETPRGKVAEIHQAQFTVLENPVPPDQPIVGTEKGYIGRGSDTSQIGDIVCVSFGCPMLVILRPLEQHHEYIREAFLLGIMFRETIKI